MTSLVWLVLSALFLFSASEECASAQDSSHNQSSTQPAGATSSQTDARKTSDTAVPQIPVAASPDPKQAQIIADVQKLVKLSQELKAEVAKSNKDTLSLTVIKKSEEVERLAKSVKEEMNKSH